MASNYILKMHLCTHSVYVYQPIYQSESTTKYYIPWYSWKSGFNFGLVDDMTSFNCEHCITHQSSCISMMTIIVVLQKVSTVTNLPVWFYCKGVIVRLQQLSRKIYKMYRLQTLSICQSQHWDKQCSPT